METQLGYNNDDFMYNRTTCQCREGFKMTYCTFPSSSEVISNSLYIRVVVFKLRRVSERLFHLMGDVKEKTGLKITFESIWPNFK